MDILESLCGGTFINYKVMKIDISTLNKVSFISVLEEEIERQTENQRMIKRQIERNSRFDGDEELVKEIDRLKSSFNIIIQLLNQNKSILEITDEDVKFFERMIRNQICISDSRIKDWQPNGLMRSATRSKYFGQNPIANDEDFEEAVQHIIQYDVDLKECVNELTKIINVE